MTVATFFVFLLDAFKSLPEKKGGGREGGAIESQKRGRQPRFDLMTPEDEVVFFFHTDNYLTA